MVRTTLARTLALALIAAPASHAQTADQEARLGHALAAMEAQSLAFYSAADPRFAPLLTPPEDVPDFRGNQRCFMARLEGDGGAEMLEAYIAALEEVSTREITSLLDLGASLPEVVLSEPVSNAAAECGPLSYSTAQMATPEFMALLDEPEVMQALMGEP